MLRKLLRWANPISRPTSPSLPLADRPAAQLPKSRVIDVTDADFATEVLAQPGLVVVDFWADWCRPCTVLSAHTEHLATVYGDRLRVVALDVDENPATPERYAIMGLPTLLFVRNGEEVGRQVGLLTYEALQAQVETLLAQAAP